MIRDYEHERGLEKDARRAEERDRKARQDEPRYFGPLDRTPERCQPCDNFEPHPDEPEFYRHSCPHCEGLRCRCACGADHHTNGWQSCPDPRIASCSHPACIAAANERIMGDLARGLGMIEAASEPPVLALCAKCLTLTASVGRLCAPCAKALAIDCNANLERDEYPWPDPRRDDDECDDFVGDAR